MEATTIETIAHWSGGRLVAGDAAAIATTIGIDSRTLKAGDLFLALRGANFDGHEFIAGAAKRGALGAVVDHVPAGLPEDFAVVPAGGGGCVSCSVHFSPFSVVMIPSSYLATTL